MVAVDHVMVFLRRQLQQLPVHDTQDFPVPSDSKMPGDRGDPQHCRFQAAAAVLVAMSSHTRKTARRNAALGAQQAIELVARNLLPLEGQSMQTAVLLDFLSRNSQSAEDNAASDDGALEIRRPVVQPWAQGANAATRQPSHHGPAMSRGDACSPGPGSKKRGHDALAGGMHLDPAFEQAFKRQCQLPPTPPRMLRR